MEASYNHLLENTIRILDERLNEIKAIQYTIGQ